MRLTVMNQLGRGLEMDLDVDDAGPGRRKLVKALAEFGGYIGANAGSIPNYGERHRSGETISNAFVESVVNQGGEQAHGEEAADALVAAGGPSLAPMPASERQDVAA